KPVESKSPALDLDLLAPEEQDQLLALIEKGKTETGEMALDRLTAEEQDNLYALIRKAQGRPLVKDPPAPQQPAQEPHQAVCTAPGGTRTFSTAHTQPKPPEPSEATSSVSTLSGLEEPRERLPIRLDLPRTRRCRDGLVLGIPERYWQPITLR